MALGISKKLFVLVFLFILIFYGTVLNLFMKVQDMSETSARIVSVNNRVAALSKRLGDSLMDMDVNFKKYTLLKKALYLDGFDRARLAYLDQLNELRGLGGSQGERAWDAIDRHYEPYTAQADRQQDPKAPLAWGSDEEISQWMAAVGKAALANQDQIDAALIHINDQSRAIVRNGMIGFGISILAGIMGGVFISRSMLRPLKRLKSGLAQVSNDNYDHRVLIRSRDEFGELAAAFNEMSRQLKADEEIRSDFIACLSHEIRTPLSSIQESVNLITEEVLGPVNEKQKKFLHIAGQENARITTLLDHLLDNARLSSQADVDRPRKGGAADAGLDANELAAEAVQGLGASAAAKDVRLTLSPMDAPVRIAGEKKEIMQVLVNILGNALKFSPEKGRVNLGLTLAPKGMLRFDISDTGPGISAQEQGLVFKKYYRAQQVRKHTDGVGLGLNIARRIVLNHGGKIFVKNNEDKGCTFSFTLPLAKQ